MRLNNCLLTALLLVVTANTHAVPNNSLPGRFEVNPLHLEGGPSRAQVNAIQRDATGYLWVGTDNGLMRYDGYNYTVFNNNPQDPGSLGSNLVLTLLIDSANTLWVGTNKLSVFNTDTETFDNYPLTDGNAIWGMAVDPDGILWVSAERTRLVGFDTRKREMVYHALYKPDGNAAQVPDNISDIINDRADPSILWMTAAGAGLYRFDTRTHQVQRFYSAEELEHVRLTTTSGLRMDRQGKIWMTSENGLYVIDPRKKSYRHYRQEKDNPRSLSTDILTAIFIDSENRVWIGTDKQGVHIYRPETDDFVHIPASTTEPGAFGAGAINDIYEDADGSLWFCVNSFGVQRVSMHLEKFTTIGSGPGDRQLSWDLLLDLLEDHNGNIWIATDGGGLNRYDPKSGRITKYFNDPDNPKSLSSNSVLSLEEDRNGRIWVGTWAGGLNRLDPKTGEFTRYQHNPSAAPDRTLRNNNIFQIAEDDAGWLWLSVWNFGLQRFNPETGEFKSFYYNDGVSGLFSSSIHAIDAGRNGSRWVGGWQGLEKYDPATQRFTEVKLSAEKRLEVFDLYEDPQGILWVATSDGLVRYNQGNGAVRHYTVADGLADNFIASIEQDRNGHLWLGTQGGLTRFDPNSESFETFDKFDGLRSNEFNRFSHLLSRDGIMYFGGNAGLVMFEPGKLPRNTKAPNIVLTGLELFQKQVVPGESPYLPRQINLLDRLTLPYDQRDLTFQFSALDFISPTKNRYRYRLLGLEESWTEADSNRRRARYTNLAPGKYQFQVTGSNNDGVWNENGAKLDLVIVPPWWMTWWARLLAVVLSLYAIYGFTMWRLRVIRRHAQQLSAEIEERRSAEQALSLEIEERRAIENKLFHIAYHDALTGLPNRLWLLERLDEQIQRVKSDDSYRFALMFIDGDRFKQINDTHGHQLGDFILNAAAQRLQNLLPEKYLPSRLGGDEFTVLVEDVKGEDTVTGVCNAIITAFNEPFQVEQNLMFFRVSMGLVFCGQQYANPGQILRDADIAMYKAKERGKGTYHIFDSKLREQTQEVTELETDLYKALEQNQLFLVYQPIVDLKTGGLSGFEALARWRHPEKGLIPPAKFIPIAEESGLILMLGDWVLRQACGQLATWISEYRIKEPPTIAVNLSSLQLNQTYFLAQVDRILHETGTNASLLKLELTESTLMKNSESMDLLLDKLRERQIELAIDDFGTGYSSLSYIDQLPVQVLKIDRKFVDGITRTGESSSSIEIVRATISMAHNLKIKVVAEGIETEEQYNLLQSYGCDFGQGYFIARPLSSEDAARFMGYESQATSTIEVDAYNPDLDNTGRFPKFPAKRRRRSK
ncbi:MAG TPA: EAL domain-containing protein [Gammaproteobacteria bacterium]|nr:EAL domain-containing protein [Gammaproteobacteria bacterium]